MKGAAIRLGDDVDTDQIIAGRYLRTKDKSVWAEHAFEDLDPGLASRLNGSVIVAGKNMGCGSSREQAAIALKEAGVVAVVAESFARIFFRNAVNRGIPMFEIPNGFICGDGDDISISLEESSVEINGRRYQALKLSDKMKEIIDAGGIIELRRREI
ncbi:MAG: 3-isopropylmalate dehydratase [Candidatus Methanomethylophilaceae archaeon]|nr:3-isopropylmalate dehydratase [Bacteroidales bacterium]MDD2532587.1 3-isopropylmalate dehydratase [Candidatus Methanomethylophilaceae archaeon]MDI9378475.1 3-isopropylmalate dehydratase [Candidatus Thermoplasmatota archaeon]MDD2778631.1 3-isopropylmalate dehydratase [Candidatus Methanomethylophilaceae archaeon]MDD3128492.1 3-isopropylmalate dehydratase [Candidatus Methanomethylophilaceae archaeon]